VWGEGADSLIFFPLAFYGVLPNDELPLMMLSQLVLKTVYEIVVLPVTIRVVRWVKENEGEVLAMSSFINNHKCLVQIR